MYVAVQTKGEKLGIMTIVVKFMESLAVLLFSTRSIPVMRVGYKLILIFLGTWLLSAAVFMAGCDRSRETTNASAPNKTVGNSIDDSILTTKIKSGLLTDPVVKGLDTKVETYKGNVQLSGFVENQAQIDRAIEIARSVDGVKSVENKMNL